MVVAHADLEVGVVTDQTLGRERTTAEGAVVRHELKATVVVELRHAREAGHAA